MASKNGKAAGEVVKEISLSELHDFPGHPFGVRDDEAMQETVESIKQFGVLVPAIVRPREEGGYELVAGHRRKRACELAGVKTLPAIVRDFDRDQAIIVMVDSNVQRENILPCEKAQAYKMKLEALRHQGQRKDLTSRQVGEKSGKEWSITQVADDAQESERQVQRYIRLTELNPELQQMVNDKKIGLTPAVEISYLKPEEQAMLVETIDSEQATPSLSQAQRMKKLSRDGALSDDTMLKIMMERKKPENFNLVIDVGKLQKYFPRNYSLPKMEETIFKLLDAWARKRQRDQTR